MAISSTPSARDRNNPISPIWGLFRMEFIAALQLKLKILPLAGQQHSTTALGSIHEVLAFLARGNIQGAQFQEKDGFGNPSFRIAKSRVIGLVSIRSILPCSTPAARENIFHCHTNFIRFPTQKTNHFLRNCPGFTLVK